MNASGLSSMGSLAFPKLPPLDNTLGALLLGSIFGFMLYGLMLHQAYRYYRIYPGDRTFLKWLVFIIIATETVHTVMWMIACYEYFVVNYFNPANIIKIYWYIKLTIPTSSTTILFCHIFYASRVYYLGTYWIYRVLVALSVIIMVMFLAWGIVATVKVFGSANIDEFAPFIWTVSVTYGHAVLVDLITASALISVLRHSRTGVKSTDSVLDTLVLYTISTGLLTTIIGILIFAFGLAYPNDLIYAGLSIPGVKLYSNSVLAMLNSRQSLSARMTQGLSTASLEPDGHGCTQTGRGPVERWNARQTPILFAVSLNTTRTGTDSRAMEPRPAGHETESRSFIHEDSEKSSTGRITCAQE
ncbi:hypothetical protein BC628DRAFT_1379021 [Trametes gibbosa]|nr:hypothetical protein BC628DRAFT_1379021 [Trametes gibbosa]